MFQNFAILLIYFIKIVINMMPIVFFWFPTVVAASKCPEYPKTDGPYPVYFRDEDDFSKFWECSNGIPYELTCPDGLYFNTELNVCDWPQNVIGDACTLEWYGTDENNGLFEIKQPVICKESEAVCPAVDGEHPVYIALKNRSQFCQCSNGIPYLQECPEGLNFNPHLNVCDWPESCDRK